MAYLTPALFVAALLSCLSSGCIGYNVQGTTNAMVAVGDFGNNRIMVWNNMPSGNSRQSSIVVGQPNWSSGAANYGGISASSLSGAFPGYFDGNTLIALDNGNFRVLIWKSIQNNFQPADLVVCQPNFTTANHGTTASQCFTPKSVMWDKQRLFVSDQNNSRVLIWNEMPTQNYQPADVVVGQLDMTSSIISTSQTGIGLVLPAYSDGQRLYVGTGPRVAVWNAIPTTNNAPADFVLGQPDFFQTTLNNTPGAPGTPSAYSLSSGRAMCVDGNRLYIADQPNNRILIWNSIPTHNQQPADMVLGQPNMASSGSNTGGISAATLSLPDQLDCGNGYLMIGDQANNRVLVWTRPITQNQQPADIVFGQPDFISFATDNGGMALGFNTPIAVSSNVSHANVPRYGGY